MADLIFSSSRMFRIFFLSSDLNITSVVQMLPGLEGFLVFSIESTIREELNVRVLYLMGRKEPARENLHRHVLYRAH